MAAALAVSLTAGGALPFMAQTVHAEDTTAEQGQTPEKQNGVVSLEKKDGSYIFGNEYLKRTFSVSTEKVLSTKEITNYRTGAGDKATVFTPQAGSEEFIINTLDNGYTGETGEFQAPKKKLDTTGWESKGDSVATNEGKNGATDLMFDGDNNTYYHSKYDGNDEAVKKYPHNIYVGFDEEKTFQSFRYQQRVDAQGEPTVSGHVKNYKIYTADSLQDLEDNNKAKLVKEGEFKDEKETYVNLDQAVTTQWVRIEFVDCHDPKQTNVSKDVACCSEFDFFEDTATFPQKPTDNATQLKTSEMKVKDEPQFEDKNGVKTLTFTFEPKKVRGVDYTVREVITMKDGDSFMRKHLEISVGADQADKAKIDYIDLENMQINQTDLKNDEYWSIKNDMANNPDMGNMKGDYLELGQPYYVGAMYWGCEFPETENKIVNSNSFIRYHYGKSLAKDKHFEYNEGNTAGKMTTWDAVVGAARSRDYSVIQSDFYEYIETIATPTDFRQQYNSWYDNMKNISDEIIKKSFFEIEKGFTQHGVEPLDSYVVDDGWTNYSSFWDFNDKFPNELYSSSLQVDQLGSNFGLWLGPRGGYGTQTQIANYIEQNSLGSKNQNSGNDINISDARYLTKLNKEIFCEYQDKFDINYWKLDGMLLEPDTDASEYYVTGNPLYTITETYERWTDMYEDMRQNRSGKDLWINMTSYTNPSPWHLQWVNSVWMQNTGDTGYTNSFNATDEEAMLTYRDNAYYDFLNERQWQLPHKYFYNHDPVYGRTANDSYNRPNDIKYTDDEMRNHLYMLGTRGTAFWEYYYSFDMFDENKWQINAEAATWIEENFDILQKSKMFGGRPNDGGVYGYSCWNGKEGILSIRNPKDVEQSYEVTYDRLIGVSEDLGSVYGKVVVGDQRHQTSEALTYGKKVTYKLKPKEVLILQFGEKDATAAKILSVKGNGKEVDVEFDETIQKPEANMFTVEGYSVKKAELNADRRTVTLTLDKAPADGRTVKVNVNGVKDIVGNATTASAENDVYVNGIVTGVIGEDLKDGPVASSPKQSIDGHDGFSITGEIKTSKKNATIVKQDGAYTVGIDDQGYLTFDFNGMKVTSKYEKKTVDKAKDSYTSEIKGIIADGKQHQFSAVKEENGMIKLYLDGQVVASTYDESKANPEVKQGTTTFAEGLTKDEVSYITVLDGSLAYDDVMSLVDTEGNVVLSKNNPKVKVVAYDVTEKKAVDEKSDRPFSMVNDGVKSTSNYLELKDTADSKNHSRYVQFDLGDEYDLTKIHLTRYWDGSRKYGPTVIQLSTDANFAEGKTTTVYNSDKNNVHKLGAGTEELYVETQQGKEMWKAPEGKPVTARYIRVYVNGRDGNAGTSDHLVEFEAYGTKKGGEIIRPEKPGVLRDVTVSVDKTELKVGDKAKATATIYPADAKEVTYEWKSSNTDVLTVDKDGNVTAKAEGKAKVIVTAKQGTVTKTAEVEITVSKKAEPEKPVLTSVTATVDKNALKVGETAKATATYEPKEAKDVTLTWSSSDEKVVTVNDKGEIKAVGEGTADVTVTATQGSGESAVTKTSKVTITVTKEAEPEKPAVLKSVKAVVDKAALKVNETAKATATYEPKEAKDVTLTWSSSDKKVATVDKDGNITAVGEGTADVTVTATQGKVKVTDKVTITVTKATEPEKPSILKDVIVKVTDDKLTVGESTKVSAKADPSDASDVKFIWKSSDENVITVDENGNVKAVGAGTAKVIVTAVQGDVTVTKEVEITVEKAGDPNNNPNNNSNNNSDKKPETNGKVPPQTGDETSPILPFMLALGAGAVIAASRKRTEK